VGKGKGNDLISDGERKSLDEVLEEAILARVRELVERLAEDLSDGREVMNPREAAEFLRMPYNSFEKVAPTIKRIRVSEQRYVYLREDLMEWLRERRV
jgi:hypothetical protein